MSSSSYVIDRHTSSDADAYAKHYNLDVMPDTRTGSMHRSTAPGSTGVTAATLTVTYKDAKSLELKGTSSNKVKYQAIKDHYKKTHNGQKLPFEARIALRPKPGSAIDAARVDAMHDALAGKGELRNHVKQPKADALVNDKRYVEPKGGEEKALGSGHFNTVYAHRFKASRTSSLKAFFGIGRVKTRVIKASGPMTHHSHAKQTGIDVEKPRVADRNVAARTSDKHLGLNIAPKATAGMLDGKPCLAMKRAPGRTCAEEYVDHPEMILDPEFQHQMSDAEVSAFASGHTDPHMQNVMVQRTEKKSLIGGETKITYKITLIDNDTCHSPQFDNPDKPPVSNNNFPIQFRSTGLPAYMDAATAKNIEKLDIASYRKDLEKNLNEDEINSSCNRMRLLKNHVIFLGSQNRIVKDWKAFTNKAGEPCAGGSVIEGTLAMAGVRQGFKEDGSPHMAPRSMGLRDVRDARRHPVKKQEANGYISKVTPDFRKVLGDELYKKIITFKEHDQKLMPPSSDAGQYRGMNETFSNSTRTAQNVQSPSNRESAEESQSDTYNNVLDAPLEPSEETAQYGVAIPIALVERGEVEGRDRSDASPDAPDDRGYDFSPNLGSRVPAPRQQLDALDDMLSEIEAQRDAFRMG